MSKTDYSLRNRHFTNYDECYNFLKNRSKNTYRMCGIEQLGFNRLGDIEMTLRVQDSDEFTYAIHSNEYSKTFFIPKYVWSHIANFLGLPTNIFDYYKLLKERFKVSELDIAMSYESEILEMLFNERNERKKLNKRLKDMFIAVFDDGFGEFPRVVKSSVYRPYEDFKALEDTCNNLRKVNARNGTAFEFQESYLSPYRSSFNFIDKNQKLELTHKGDQINAGFNLTNSETKNSSYRFQVLIMRMICANGLISTFPDTELTVMHAGDDFSIRCQKAFIKCLNLSNEFAKKFYELDKHTKVISNQWNDILDIPSEYLSLSNVEKQELIEIANKENYDLNPYGLVQALTYKSNHGANDDKTFDKYNNKALKILKNAKDIAEWIPKRLQENKTTENNQNILDVNDFEFNQ